MSKKEAPAEPGLKRQLRQMLFLLDQKNREIRVAGIMGFLLGGVVGAIIAQMTLKIL